MWNLRNATRLVKKLQIKQNVCKLLDKLPLKSKLQTEKTTKRFDFFQRTNDKIGVSRQAIMFSLVRWQKTLTKLRQDSTRRVGHTLQKLKK